MNHRFCGYCVHCNPPLPPCSQKRRASCCAHRAWPPVARLSQAHATTTQPPGVPSIHASELCLSPWARRPARVAAPTTPCRSRPGRVGLIRVAAPTSAAQESAHPSRNQPSHPVLRAPRRSASRSGTRGRPRRGSRRWRSPRGPNTTSGRKVESNDKKSSKTRTNNSLGDSFLNAISSRK